MNDKDNKFRRALLRKPNRMAVMGKMFGLFDVINKDSAYGMISSTWIYLEWSPQREFEFEIKIVEEKSELENWRTIERMK